jgi:FkbM family methyltransferase
MRFIDLGAHAGHFTLIASRIVSTTGRVLAVEPAPSSVTHLRHHLAVNRVTNVDVMEVAVSARAGSARFTDAPGSLGAHLSNEGEQTVPTVTLDDLVERWGGPPPACIKLNIEGAELSALRGGQATLARARPVLFVATHGDDTHHACIDLLAGHGYRVEALGAAQMTDGGFLHRTLVAKPG